MCRVTLHGKLTGGIGDSSHDRSHNRNTPRPILAAVEPGGHEGVGGNVQAGTRPDGQAEGEEPEGKAVGKE